MLVEPRLAHGHERRDHLHHLSFHFFFVISVQDTHLHNGLLDTLHDITTLTTSATILFLFLFYC